MSKKVVDELKKVLGSTYALYLKTQNFHWNVTGPQFYALHSAFEAQYNDLFGAVDEIAERIRILGEKAPATFDEFKKLSKIKDGDANATALEMLKQITADQEVILKVLASAFKEADAAGDQVTQDLLVGRMKVHEKTLWMLKSTLEK